MLEHLSFKGEWRQYQKRILEKSDSIMADGHIHLVAAPGSGKTTLGIEFIRRNSKPALILVPTVTIRQQWVDRIREAFLDDESLADEMISQNLKQPKTITVATYQALHSAINRLEGDAEVEDTDDVVENEHFDFKGVDIVGLFEEANLGTLCLDECHHLRNEWWKSLEIFRKSFADMNVISLTATPPYEGEPALWERYVAMCGEIDEEITVPELVKEGSLCPHQDYVYFSFPTKEEENQLDQFSTQKRAFLKNLSSDSMFCEAVRTSRALDGTISEDELLNEPKYLSATLIFLRHKGIEFPKQFQQLLGASRLPMFDLAWFEILLQGMVFDVPHWYDLSEEALKELKSELKSLGLIDRKQVQLCRNKKIDQLLNQSLGKLNAVRDIFKAEHETLGSELRQLILTDFIRKDFEAHLGNPEIQYSQLGVLPYFEVLRRELEEQQLDVPVAVLTGSLVIIPSGVKSRLEAVFGADKITFQTVGQLDEKDYVKVRLVGSQHDLVSAVTQLFQEGQIHVVIGTKSLLGEGWDAPCVNSLILASFVGSFMLSNQMRGRAIRIWPENPEKTSSVWHLVSINLAEKKLFKKEEGEEDLPIGIDSPDMELLQRRMKQFLGLHYNENTIESGVDRLDLGNIEFTKKHLTKLNQETISRSRNREELRERWNESLPLLEDMEVASEVQVDKAFLPTVLLTDARKILTYAQAIVLTELIVYLFLDFVKRPSQLLYPVGILSLIVLNIVWLRYFLYKSPYKRLELFAESIRKALLASGHLQTQNCKARVVRGDKDSIQTSTYLKGGTLREKELFAQALSEFFAPIENQRYILRAETWVNDQTKYFAVPSMFDKRKEDVVAFVANIEKNIGKYEIIYTRNVEGRHILLDARLNALGNKQERTFSKKKVTSKLK
ncbi:DEAD/DEAH box helicase family protein [uncultured Granulicatella sp.]|uniref:DEAD/DEAH box helicase family protein n=1 Tax=uncultured Granulicatella sp. TaxID=316089 RepID=UPI0028052465|nr:DEAD/DEAH box helicase family protein [uncultured Granulicatella sp.]